MAGKHTLEAHNRSAIEGLNQRGGRMLSLIDLIKARTVSLELASEMVFVVSHRGSFLTAAGPGGVGKTTLMGALLAFLPPDTEIVTVETTATLKPIGRPETSHPQCLMVHEIGSGFYYGYLWGQAVAEYFALQQATRPLASNLHAVTYGQARALLTGPTLNVAAAHFAQVDLLAFMSKNCGERRVATVWQADGRGAHVQSWRWHEGRDAFERCGSSKTAAREDISDCGLETFARKIDASTDDVNRGLDRIRELLMAALDEDCHLITQLRKRALKSLF